MLEVHNVSPTKRLCKYYALGHCDYGDSCVFDHPPGLEGTAPCPHFARGSCLYGASCQYNHPPNLQVMPLPRVYKPSGRPHIRNTSKAATFRRFLIDTFGRDMLTSGTGVIDVAGGKGELAFEMANLNRISITVFDPRPLRIDRFRKKWAGGFYHQNPIFQCYVDVDQQQEPIEPDSVRLFFQPFLYDSSIDIQVRLQQLDECESKSRSVVWGHKGLQFDHQLIDQDHEHHHSSSHYPAWDHLQALLQDCSCIVGLHPDQAAEYIVDFALACKKPFALIPCCTYSKEFPKRKKIDGTPVTSYTDLVEHLKSKHPAIQQKTLDFEGKNIVLYLETRDL